MPVSAPLVRGILATAFVELPEEWTQERVERLYRDAYAGEPFVRVPRRRLPGGGGGVRVEPRRGGRGGRARRWPGARTVTCLGATDNLVKGGAGQAIQNMNLMLGLDEKASLADPGPWPP